MTGGAVADEPLQKCDPKGADCLIVIWPSGMVQANVGQKLVKHYKITSFHRCPKLRSGHCSNEYKRNTTTTPPYVILIPNLPNKLNTHLS
jgi:hypothetical protein